MGSEQQFCLRWNNHHVNMLNVFDHLLQSETLVDVTLACEGLSLRAHKMVLSACSPYFQSLFTENPCKHPIVILKDVSGAELRALLDFMYKGEVNISHEKLSSLLKTAEYLKIKGLSEVTHGKQLDGETTMVASQQSQLTKKEGSEKMGKRKRTRHRNTSQSSTSENESNLQLDVQGSPEIVESQVDVPQMAEVNHPDEVDHYSENDHEMEEKTEKIEKINLDVTNEQVVLRAPPVLLEMAHPSDSLLLSPPLPSTSTTTSPSTAQGLIPLSRRALAYAPQRCRLCQKVISNIYNFRKHMKVHSPVQQRFECHLCLRVYNREDNLRWHLRTKHGVQLRRKPRRLTTPEIPSGPPPLSEISVPP